MPSSPLNLKYPDTGAINKPSDQLIWHSQYYMSEHVKIGKKYQKKPTSKTFFECLMYVYDFTSVIVHC